MRNAWFGCFESVNGVSRVEAEKRGCQCELSEDPNRPCSGDHTVKTFILDFIATFLGMVILIGIFFLMWVWS